MSLLGLVALLLQNVVLPLMLLLLLGTGARPVQAQTGGEEHEGLVTVTGEAPMT